AGRRVLPRRGGQALRTAGHVRRAVERPSRRRPRLRVTAPADWVGAWRRRRATEKMTRQVLRGPPREAYAAFGRGSVFGPPVRVTRPDRISIGDNVIIHEGGWLSVVEAHPGHPP